MFVCYSASMFVCYSASMFVCLSASMFVCLVCQRCENVTTSLRRSSLFGAPRAVVFRFVWVAYTFLLVLNSPDGEFKR